MSVKQQAEMLVTDYLLTDSFLPYTSIFAGIVMSKMAYDVTRSISFHYFKGFTSLTKIQQIEWNNRGMSTIHAIYITIMSIYLVFFSDLYTKYDQHQQALLFTLRSSPLSTFTLGVSVGYFIIDLSMIYWSYPSLGGMQFVLHHLLSLLQ